LPAPIWRIGQISEDAFRHRTDTGGFRTLDSHMQRNYTVGHLIFEWDEDKAAGNVIKHLVTFEEAATVFRDPMGRLIADPDHSAVEDRFLLLGHSASGRLLVVAHAQRGPDESIRLISARRAVPRERSTYGN
jgi:uncharacterized DUF497 family protein